MTTPPDRRKLLQAGAAILGGATLTTTLVQTQGFAAGNAAHEFVVKDIVYQRNGGKERLARLYHPPGNGPFPAPLPRACGASDNNDPTGGPNTALHRSAPGKPGRSNSFRAPPAA